MDPSFSRGIILSVCILVFFLFRPSVGLLKRKGGKNVCSTTVSYTGTSNQSLQTSLIVKERTIYKTTYRVVTRISYRKQYQCCKGWSQVGDQCTKDCPSHKWGTHCRHDCLCQNKATCSPHTGTCTCTPGWEGQYCNKTCDQGCYGNKCLNKCTCVNGATCDPVSGNCACAAGYRGQRCEKLCKDDIMDGHKCRGVCACRNNATCSPNWFCNCTTGYTGMLCERQCSAVRHDCLRQCNCSQWGDCNPYSGLCICQPGYTGETCDTQCPDGKYGPECTGVCHCDNNATCSKVDGSCDCLPGWTGVECNNPCPAGYFGKTCQKKCLCQNGASCDTVTGQCTCVGEWQGEFCNTSMSFNSSKQSDDAHGILLPSVLSGAGFILLLIVIAVVVLLCRKRRKSRGIVASTNNRDKKSARKRRERDKKNAKTFQNSNEHIILQTPLYENFTALVPQDSHVASIASVALETGKHGEQEHCYGNLKSFNDYYEPLGNQGKEDGGYQGLSFQRQSTGELFDSLPLYDNMPRVAENPRVPENHVSQWEFSQTAENEREDNETYVTFIS